MLAPQTAVSLAEAQDLIFLEAELLDAWRLDDWIKLYTDDMTYLVPSPGMPAARSRAACTSGPPTERRLPTRCSAFCRRSGSTMWGVSATARRRLISTALLRRQRTTSRLSRGSGLGASRSCRG